MVSSLRNLAALCSISADQSKSRTSYCFSRSRTPRIELFCSNRAERFQVASNISVSVSKFWPTLERKEGRHVVPLYVTFFMVTIPLIIAKNVPYGSLNCLTRLQNDRQKLRGMMADLRKTSLCKPVSKIILFWCEKNRSLFACHLVIFQSSTAHHASLKRRDSGLPADVKIRTIVQLVFILRSYFWEYLDIHGSVSII